MKIQSLSVVVPNKGCVNSCKFCVSRMHRSEYENFLTTKSLYYDLYKKDYFDRLNFARDNNCNTIMLTGDSEPQQNWDFLKFFGDINQSLEKPFRNIEMQTTGTLLDDHYLYFLRHHVGVKTISLSMSSFDNDKNQEYNGTPDKIKVDIKTLCNRIKKYRFNLRVSINLTDWFNAMTPEEIFTYCKNELDADQVTFRVLYVSGNGNSQDKWIAKHSATSKLINNITNYVAEKGRSLEVLEFGATKYSLSKMSVVVDDDCMNKVPKDSLKYLVLRENCKLYTKWDDEGSLLF